MRLTSGGRNLWPIWMPDGQRITFASTRTGSARLYRIAADGSGLEEQLTTTSYNHAPRAWLADGSTLLFDEVHPTTNWDMWCLPMDTKKPWEFQATKYREFQGAFSPDGRWVAFTSNDSGRNEVYVRPFPGPEPRSRVSTNGGQEPLWNRNGRELFFRLNDAVMAVEIHPQSTFEAGQPRVLFSGPFIEGVWTTSYDVAPDGQRFIMTRYNDNLPAPQVTVVLNWATVARDNLARR